MAKLGTLVVSSCAVVAAMAVALPAAAGPDDEPDVDVSPRSVASGQTFSVTVSGCAGGRKLQVQIDPAGIVASASCEGAPGFASAQFLAAGPLAEAGSYDAVVFDASRELGRARLKVSATAEEATEQELKPIEEVAPVPDGPPPTTVVDEPDPTVPTTAPVDEPTDEPDDAPSATASLDELADDATSVDGPADEPNDAVSVDAAEPTAAAAAADDDDNDDNDNDNDNDDLADTGAAASAGVAVGALIAVLAGGALLALARRRPA